MPCEIEPNRPAFSKGKDNELWVILLEKAYAKAFGSYYTIEGGDPADALRDLTGAPTEAMDDQQDTNKLWRFVLNAEKSHWIICCYTQSTDIREEQKCIGIIQGHAYTILDVRELRDADNNQIRLLKIRNPWGYLFLFSNKFSNLNRSFEWEGDWSDKSELWTPALKREVDLKVLDDGTFWMNIEDF